MKQAIILLSVNVSLEYLERMYLVSSCDQYTHPLSLSVDNSVFSIVLTLVFSIFGLICLSMTLTLHLHNLS